jgi:hypothetical protein
MDNLLLDSKLDAIKRKRFHDITVDKTFVKHYFYLSAKTMVARSKEILWLRLDLACAIAR